MAHIGILQDTMDATARGLGLEVIDFRSKK